MKLSMLLALSAGLLVPALSRAQQTQRVALRLDLTNVWTRTDFPGQTSVYRGPALGGEGRLAIGRGIFFVSAQYLEGRLTLKDAPAAAAHQDLVQGSLAVIAKPTSWLEISFGPAARAYVTDSSTERWVIWRLRTRVEAPLIAHQLTSYFEIWKSLSSSLNVEPGAGRVQGGETGLRYEPNGPVSVSLSYHIDDSLFNGPGQSETLEWLSVGIGWGL